MKRYAAVPPILHPQRLRKRPVLSLHSTYDNYVPGWMMNAYNTITQEAVTHELFVQTAVIDMAELSEPFEWFVNEVKLKAFC